MRCSSLEGGFSLWEEHIEEARRHVAAMGSDAFEICYEDFLADPVAHLEKMAIFCSLQPDGRKLASIARKVNKDQESMPFWTDPELARLCAAACPPG